MIPAIEKITRPENLNSISKADRNTISSPVILKDRMISSASSEIRRVSDQKEDTPVEMMDNVVSAGSKDPDNIDSAHDFNLARVLELLSDPLLQEDMPESGE